MRNKQLMKVQTLRGDYRAKTIILPFALWFKIDRVVTHYGGASADHSEVVVPRQGRDMATILFKQIREFDQGERELVLLIADLADQGLGLRLNRTYQTELGGRYGVSVN